MMVRTDTTFEYDLSGGNLCLDFVNTVSDRTGEPVEHLGSYSDLLEFAHQAGAMSEREVGEMEREALRDSARAEAVMQQVVDVREAVYRIFRAVATDGVPEDSDLEALNAVLVQGLAKARLVREGEAYRWSWAGDCSCLERPLWQVAHSAADLLTSGRLNRIRLCGSDTCEWLFLDESRNRSRRWCDMATCGNREKARRHYEKVKARED